MGENNLALFHHCTELYSYSIILTGLQVLSLISSLKICKCHLETSSIFLYLFPITNNDR